MRTIQLLERTYRLKDIWSAQKFKEGPRQYILLKLDTINGKYNEMIDYSDYSDNTGEVQLVDRDFERLTKALEVKELPEDINFNPVEILMAEDLKDLKEEFKNFSIVDIIDFYRKEMEMMLR